MCISIWVKWFVIYRCIDENAFELMKQINEINAAVNHKSFNPKTDAHKKFKNTTLITGLPPYSNLNTEKALI